MIVLQKFLEPVKEHVAFLFGHIVDELTVLANGVKTAPACDGMCSNYGMYCFQLTADVLFGSTRFLVETEATSGGRLDKVRTSKCARQTF